MAFHICRNDDDVTILLLLKNTDIIKIIDHYEYILCNIECIKVCYHTNVCSNTIYQSCFMAILPIDDIFKYEKCKKC